MVKTAQAAKDLATVTAMKLGDQRLLIRVRGKTRRARTRYFVVTRIFRGSFAVGGEWFTEVEAEEL